MTARLRDIIHKNLDDLRIISLLQPGDKLCTKNGLTIQPDTWFRYLIRRFMKESFSETIRYLTDLYHEFYDKITIIISEKKNGDPDGTIVTLLITCGNVLISSIKGLETLLQTYMAYSEFQASLIGLVDDYIIPMLDCLRAVVPIHQQPDQFKNTLVFNQKIIYIGADLQSSKAVEIVEKHKWQPTEPVQHSPTTESSAEQSTEPSPTNSPSLLPMQSPSPL